jgi:hypothetical protein
MWAGTETDVRTALLSGSEEKTKKWRKLKKLK